MSALAARSPRVALLSPCYWPEVRRGTERFIRELADGLIARGQAPTLITSHPRAAIDDTLEDGLRVIRLPRAPQRRLVRRGYLPYLTHVPLSYVALRRGDYDVAHAVYPSDAWAALRWRRATRRPVVFSFMGIPDRPALREYRGMLTLMQRAGTADALVALSRHAADAFTTWLGYEARVIAPGVDIQTFRPGAPRSAVPTIVCSAAPEVPRKHVALLVDAFGLVRREHPNARLVLSEPPEAPGAIAAGVDMRAPGVEWRNLDSREHLAAAYGEAWVAALPSENEAFGLVLAEALACGTPVVGYRSGAIPEIVDRPAIGRLFDTLSPDALAEALLATLELSAHPATSDACRSRAEGFSTDRCAEAYLALYRDLVTPA